MLAATIALLAVSSEETGLAQGQPAGQTPQTPTSGAQPQTPPAQPSMPRIVVTAGRSTVLSTEFNVTRIAITNPAVAEATVVAPREILIDGKAAGTISLIVWGDSRRTQYDIVVEQPVAALQQQLQALFPGENIQVSTNEDATVLSGTVSSTSVMLRAGEIATAAATKRKVINLLQVPGGSESQQVLLQVRFAEVNRRAIQELGVNFFSTRPDATGRMTTRAVLGARLRRRAGGTGLQRFSQPLLLQSQGRPRRGHQGARAEGHVSVTRGAKPDRLQRTGSELSGRRRVPRSGRAGQLPAAVTVQFKEFGIRLTFTPTIAGDMIRLKVVPEVSTLDFANGVTLGGFRIPALTTRRAQTDVELRDGQSFAIAGLLDNQAQDDTAGIPLLSKLPIIGYLFRSKAERSQQTELMVLITPRLVRPLNPDEVPPLPTRFKSFVPEGGVGKGMDGPGLVDAPAAENGNGARQAQPVKGQK